MRRLIFDEEHETFRASVRRFFQNEIAPNGARWRAQGFVDRWAFTKAGEQGYLLPWAPEEFGGIGVDDFRYEQIVYEENIRYGETGFYLQLHSGLVAPYIRKLGTEAQKAAWLPACVKGQKILAIAMTEPGPGSDLAGLRTSAVDRGDHWLVDGAKTYISNGQLADLVIVAARTVPDRRHGIGLFVVEVEMSGFRRGQRLHQIGLHAQDT